jgi:hypothetical protein
MSQKWNTQREWQNSVGMKFILVGRLQQYLAKSKKHGKT